jgi:hypothetical protein
MIIAQLSWKITLMSKMESWSLRWIRTLIHLNRTPHQRQIQSHSRSRSRNRNHSLSPMTLMTTKTSAQQLNLIMMLSCMATPVNHPNITRQAAAPAALNATSPGLQTTLIAGIQLWQLANVYQNRWPQNHTSMAKRLWIRKLAFALRAASSAVGVGPRTIL